MSYVCLWSPGWPTAGGVPPELAASLLGVVPRVVAERRGVVWADVRGLPARQTAEALLAAAGEGGVRAGLAAVPIAAEVAARAGQGALQVVEPGREREYLAPMPLALLGADERLLRLLEGVGVQRAGELAALAREAVEVRFGAEGAALWRLARADDPRPLFLPIPPERPHASLDFIDYEVRDPERLVFTANALLGGVCDALRSRGEHARALALTLSLSGGGRWRRSLRAARPTASREVWLRRVRQMLEGAQLPDAVTGVMLEVEGTEAAAALQGDLFDRGFATADAVEAALARLLERQEGIIVEPRHSAHPLLERRVEWIPVDPFHPTAARPPAEHGEPCLTLQLFPDPRPIEVEARDGRDHLAPLRYRERERWIRFLTVAGPDRISGGRWGEDAYTREYFRCVSEDGALLWLFRDARCARWYLHGWWD